MHTARHRLTRVALGAGAVLAAVIGLSVLPPTTVTAQQRVLTPEEMDVEFVRLWNENKLDELGDLYYAEDRSSCRPTTNRSGGRRTSSRT